MQAPQVFPQPALDLAKTLFDDKVKEKKIKDNKAD